MKQNNNRRSIDQKRQPPADKNSWQILDSISQNQLSIHGLVNENDNSETFNNNSDIGLFEYFIIYVYFLQIQTV